jgi:hypothetical protein
MAEFPKRLYRIRRLIVESRFYAVAMQRVIYYSQIHHSQNRPKTLAGIYTEYQWQTTII